MDGTNTTRDRRDIIRNRVAQEDGYNLLWIESAAESNTENKLTPSEEEELKHSPDFIDKKDYEKRLAYYEVISYLYLRANILL